MTCVWAKFPRLTTCPVCGHLAAQRSSWIEKSSGFYHEDIRFMQELIPVGSSILEIGCGNGNLIGSLKPSYGLGIDISSKMIAEAKYKYKDIDFIEADIEQKNLFTEINRKFEYLVREFCNKNC